MWKVFHIYKAHNASGKLRLFRIFTALFLSVFGIWILNLIISGFKLLIPFPCEYLSTCSSLPVQLHPACLPSKQSHSSFLVPGPTLGQCSVVAGQSFSHLCSDLFLHLTTWWPPRAPPVSWIPRSRGRAKKFCKTPEEEFLNISIICCLDAFCRGNKAQQHSWWETNSQSVFFFVLPEKILRKNFYFVWWIFGRKGGKNFHFLPTFSQSVGGFKVEWGFRCIWCIFCFILKGRFYLKHK